MSMTRMPLKGPWGKSDSCTSNEILLLYLYYGLILHVVERCSDGLGLFGYTGLIEY